MARITTTESMRRNTKVLKFKEDARHDPKRSKATKTKDQTRRQQRSLKVMAWEEDFYA